MDQAQRGAVICSIHLPAAEGGGRGVRQVAKVARAMRGEPEKCEIFGSEDGSDNNEPKNFARSSRKWAVTVRFEGGNKKDSRSLQTCRNLYTERHSEI